MRRETVMSERVIGILGGMGPEATADLFREIVRLTPAKKDQDHVPVLIYSNPKIPERTAAILGEGEDAFPLLTHSARVLKQAGAGILAIPCNTAHYYVPALEREVGIPVLNMIVETLRDLNARLPEARAVGLLASLGTVRSRIYDCVFQKNGVDVVVPETADQELVSAAIYKVKAGTQDEKTRQSLESVGAKLISLGVQAVILGCTEIPLAFNESSVGYPCLNPTRSLAQAAVDWALGRRD